LRLQLASRSSGAGVCASLVIISAIPLLWPVLL